MFQQVSLRYLDRWATQGLLFVKLPMQFLVLPFAREYLNTTTSCLNHSVYGSILFQQTVWHSQKVQRRNLILQGTAPVSYDQDSIDNFPGEQQLRYENL